MKHVLFVGANSAFAKRAKELLESDFKIITAGRKDCDYNVDLKNEFNLPKNIDIVINFAASFGGKTDDEIKNAIETNVVGLFNLCKACKKANVKHLVSISSIFTKLSKDHPQYNIYAVTKKQADILAEYYCMNEHINLTILCPSQIYGYDDSFRKNQPFFYHIIDKAQKGEDIDIYGKNDALRNYICVDDLIEILKRVVLNEVYGNYDCIYPVNISYGEIAKTAFKVFGKGGKINFISDKADIPNNIFTYDDKLYKLIEYTPVITIEQGIMHIKKHREEQ